MKRTRWNPVVRLYLPRGFMIEIMGMYGMNENEGIKIYHWSLLLNLGPDRLLLHKDGHGHQTQAAAEKAAREEVGGIFRELNAAVLEADLST